MNAPYFNTGANQNIPTSRQNELTPSIRSRQLSNQHQPQSQPNLQQLAQQHSFLQQHQPSQSSEQQQLHHQQQNSFLQHHVAQNQQLNPQQQAVQQIQHLTPQQVQQITHQQLQQLTPQQLQQLTPQQVQQLTQHQHQIQQLTQQQQIQQLTQQQQIQQLAQHHQIQQLLQQHQQHQQQQQIQQQQLQQQIQQQQLQQQLHNHQQLQQQQSNHFPITPAPKTNPSQDASTRQLSTDFLIPKTEYIEEKKCEVYRFNSTNPLYSTAISNRNDSSKLRLGVGSLFMGQETFRSNKISVVELDDSSNSLVLRHTLDHSFPATKVQFTPDGQSYYDLMGTTSDALRIFRISNEGKMTLLDTLHSSANLGYSGPYSSMDWNTYDPTIIGVSSNDSTCLIWQLETSQCVTISKAKVKSHLISNDKSVNEIGFMSKDTFVTASDDGSIRQFDIRDMKSSTILYDGGTEKTPLVRVQTNKKDGNLLGVLGSHSNKILIIDVRKPDRVYKTCVNPNAEINSIAWSPANKQLICSGSSDNQALIWQVKDELAEGTSTKTYNANAEISNVQWGPRHPQWISITFDKSVEILRV